jgi:hypothetical protein
MSKDLYTANAAVLARWAEQASGGVLTIEVPDYEKRSQWASAPSLRRLDGGPLGYYEAGSERRPISGIQLDIYLSDVSRLTRRNTITMRVIRNAVRRAFYGSDDGTYSALREWRTRNWREPSTRTSPGCTDHLKGA